MHIAKISYAIQRQLDKTDSDLSDFLQQANSNKDGRVFKKLLQYAKPDQKVRALIDFIRKDIASFQYPKALIPEAQSIIENMGKEISDFCSDNSNSFYEHPVLTAVSKIDNQYLEMLIELGLQDARFNVQAVNIAIERDNLKALSMLLANGAELPEDALITAIRNDSTNTLRQLLFETDLDPSNPDITDILHNDRRNELVTHWTSYAGIPCPVDEWEEVHIRHDECEEIVKSYSDLCHLQAFVERVDGLAFAKPGTVIKAPGDATEKLCEAIEDLSEQLGYEDASALHRGLEKYVIHRNADTIEQSKPSSNQSVNTTKTEHQELSDEDIAGYKERVEKHRLSQDPEQALAAYREKLEAALQAIRSETHDIQNAESASNDNTETLYSTQSNTRYTDEHLVIIREAFSYIEPFVLAPRFTGEANGT